MNKDYSITDDQKHALKEDGIVKLPGLIDSSLLKELNKCFDWSISNHGPIASFSKINNSDEDISFVDNGNPDAKQMYDDLIARSGFGSVIAELWNSKYVGYFAEEIFWKKGKTGPTVWHQDTAYQPWRGEHWCNLWIPLVGMDSEQSIQIVKESHKGIQYDGTTFDPYNPTQPLWGENGNFPRLPNISSDLKKNLNSWDIVSFEVEPGDAVVLHPHCLHRGGGSSDTLPERRNIVFRFFGDKGYYSDHLPKTKSMFELKPIPSAKGGYLEDGDLFRPTDMITVFESERI